ncbi:MAG: hypothetical protein UMU76_03270 [Prosthecochloris sp.]|nr:hypothetical protein [Prosthecochloris sp.]
MKAFERPCFAFLIPGWITRQHRKICIQITAYVNSILPIKPICIASFSLYIYTPAKIIINTQDSTFRTSIENIIKTCKHTYGPKTIFSSGRYLDIPIKTSVIKPWITIVIDILNPKIFTCNETCSKRTILRFNSDITTETIQEYEAVLAINPCIKTLSKHLKIYVISYYKFRAIVCSQDSQTRIIIILPDKI